MKIGFFPNLGKVNILEVLVKTAQICQSYGIEVFIPNDTEDVTLVEKLGIDKAHALPRPEIYEKIDLAFSFGGDGTIIHLSRLINTYNVPVCGINLGELGFLNQIELEELESCIKKIVEGAYTIEDRTHFSAFIHRKEGMTEELVPIMNDLAITHTKAGKMARIILTIDGGKTQMYCCDGLIIATSTGSTGYNLSAGGPIMTPDNHSMIITPVAPHLMQGASLVLKECAKVDISMPERQQALHISVDGTFDYQLDYGDSIHLISAPVYCKYVRFNDREFFSTLFKKLKGRSEEY